MYHIQGLAGWVTANYLGETLIKDPKEFNDMAVKGLTYGALDWGGASAQITMEVILQIRFLILCNLEH